MFHCKILARSKRIRFEDISYFDQADLDEDDVMLLDGGDEVYAWIGSGTTQEEKEKAMYMAKVTQYLDDISEL